MGSSFSYLIFQIYSLIRTTTLSKDSLYNTISTTGRLQAMKCTMLQLVFCLGVYVRYLLFYFVRYCII